MTKARIAFPRIVCLCLFALFLTVPVWGQGFSPVQEQEYLDARQAVEQAKGAQAETYAAAELKSSGDWLLTAGKARETKDAALFTQASRLARAHAELAEAQAGLKKEQDALTATNDSLQKTKAAIEGLRKLQ